MREMASRIDASQAQFSPIFSMVEARHPIAHAAARSRWAGWFRLRRQRCRYAIRHWHREIAQIVKILHMARPDRSSRRSHRHLPEWLS